MTYTVKIQYANGKVINKNFSGFQSLLNAREYLNNQQRNAKPLQIKESKIKQAYSLYTI
jgi:hypothetical protein